MADKKLTELDALTTVASGDKLYVVDVSDTTDSTGGTSKYIIKDNLVTDLTPDDITGVTASVAELNVLDGITGVTGADTTLVTGSGLDGYLGLWNSDGDLADLKACPDGVIIGSTDTQTLTNKTIVAPIIDQIENADGEINVLIESSIGDNVNYITLVNSVTSNPIGIKAEGSDANIGLDIRSKGTGSIDFTDDGDLEILSLEPVASAVNEVSITNATTTNPPTISATGGDTNINLLLNGKGTGLSKADVLKTTTKARAYLSATQANLTDSTSVKINFDTESYDTGSNFASGAFTAPVTGYYMVAGRVVFANNVADKVYYAFIYVNDSQYSCGRTHTSSTSTTAIDMSDICYVQASEEIEIYAQVNSVGGDTVDVLHGPINSFIAVHLLST